MELCGAESFSAWKGYLDDLVVRGLRVPVLAIIDGTAGLVLRFSLVASGQIKLRKIDGWRNIAAEVSRHQSPAAA